MSDEPSIVYQEGVCPLATRDVVDRIVTFVEAIGEVSLYTYQSLFCRRIVESVIQNDGAVITGLWARQSGKTETVADVILGMAFILPSLAKAFSKDPRFMPFAKGFWAGIYAPVQEQSVISFSRIRTKVESENGQMLLADPELDVGIVSCRGDTLVLTNGSIVIARTASPDTKIEGKTHHVIICEESQRLLRSKVEKEIRPMAAATNGTMVQIGTAWESRGGFHNSIETNLDIHKKGGPRNHFEFPYDIVISEKTRAYEKDKNPFHLNYEKFVKSELVRVGGPDQIEFKMNFRCLWQESRVIALSPGVIVMAARKNVESGPRSRGMIVGGLDVGKINDPSVLTLIEVDNDHPVRNMSYLPGAEDDKQVYYRKMVVDWLEMEGSFEGNTGQYYTLIEYLRETSIQVLVVDATAMGDPVYERIEAMIGSDVVCVPFKFSGMSKALLYKYYLQEFNSGRLSYVAGPETSKRHEFTKFVQQNLDLDREDRGGYVLCQAPEGGHDDYPDSAALACWAEKISADQVMPEVTSTSWDGEGGSQRSGGSFMGASSTNRFGRRR